MKSLLITTLIGAYAVSMAQPMQLWLSALGDGVLNHKPTASIARTNSSLAIHGISEALNETYQPFRWSIRADGVSSQPTLSTRTSRIPEV